jgi:hypothetical protein
MSERWGEGRETDDSDGLHVAVRKGEETLSGESHVGLPVAVVALLVALFVLEFVPERLGGETGAGRSAGERYRREGEAHGTTYAGESSMPDTGRWWTMREQAVF